MTIYTYEIDVRLTHKATRQAQMVTVTEYAYSVTDAVMQMVHHVVRDHGAEVDLLVMRIGPPESAIREQSQRLREAIEQRTKQLT